MKVTTAIIVVMGVLFSLTLILVVPYLFSTLFLSLFSLNQGIKVYIASLITMIILYLLSSEKVQHLGGELLNIVADIDSLLNPELSSNIAVIAFVCIPKKTLIYIIYLLILILNQLGAVDESLNIMPLLPPNIQEFVLINQYTIIILISIDRIFSTFQKEKGTFNNMRKWIRYWDPFAYRPRK